MVYADSIFAALPKPYTVASTTFLRDYLDYYNETPLCSIPNTLPVLKLSHGMVRKHLFTVSGDEVRDI